MLHGGFLEMSILKQNHVLILFQFLPFLAIFGAFGGYFETFFVVLGHLGAFFFILGQFLSL